MPAPYHVAIAIDQPDGAPSDEGSTKPDDDGALGQRAGEAAEAGTPSVTDGGSLKLEGESEVDPFLVTLRGREHLDPKTWGVGYRWFLTVFAGLLVLNCSKA